MEEVDQRIKRVADKFKGFCEEIGGRFGLSDEDFEYKLTCKLPEERIVRVATEEELGVYITSKKPFKVLELNEGEVPQSRTIKCYGSVDWAAGSVGLGGRSMIIFGRGTEVRMDVRKDFEYMEVLVW